MRFPEFTEPWERYKLSEFATKITKKNRDNSISNVLSNSATLGIVQQSQYFEREIVTDENLVGYYVINEDDFVYNPRKSVTAPYGPVNRYYCKESGIISPLYLCFKVNGINKSFLLWFFKSPKWYRYIHLNGDSGVRHDRVSIKDDLFLDMPINVPSRAEQEKVSNLFELIDRRIAAQSKLIEDLQQLKSALVDELFCDKANWVTYKCKDILHPVCERNKALKINNVLSASQEHGMISRDELDIDIKYESSAISTYKIVQPGDYVLHLRSFQGGLAFSRITGICSPAYTIFRPTKAVTYGFLEEFFMSKRFINSLRLVTYGIRDGRSINVDEFLNMNISIPNMDTQCKIVQILSVFRQRLNNAQSILQKYIVQKQYLLGQMFI